MERVSSATLCGEEIALGTAEYAVGADVPTSRGSRSRQKNGSEDSAGSRDAVVGGESFFGDSLRGRVKDAL